MGKEESEAQFRRVLLSGTSPFSVYAAAVFKGKNANLEWYRHYIIRQVVTGGASRALKRQLDIKGI